MSLKYYDLLDACGPSFPFDLELPVVMIGNSVLTAGGKISVPAIRKRLEALRPGDKPIK